MAPLEYYAPAKDIESASLLNTNFQHSGVGTTLQEYYSPAQSNSSGSGIATGFHGLPFNTGFDPQNFKNLHGHLGPVIAVAFSPYGNQVAAGSKSGGLRLWSLTKNHDQRFLPGHSDAVATVSYSADGIFLASGSADQTIRLWKTATGQAYKRLNGHTAAVTAVAFLQDGKFLVSGSEDRTIRVWDLATGACRTVSGQKPQLAAVGFSWNGELAALSSYGTGPSLKLFDLIDPKFRFLSNLGAIAHAVAFSRDGKTLAAGLADNTVQYWDIAKDESYVLTGHRAPVFAITCSDDDKMIISGSADGTVRIWNKAEVQNHLIISTEAKVWSVSFAQDGTQLAVGLGNGVVRIFGRVAQESAEAGRTLKGTIMNLFKGNARFQQISNR